MGCLLTFFYYVAICAIGISVIFNSMFGDGSEYVDRLAGPGFVAFSFIFSIAVAPILAIVTNYIVTKIFTEIFIKQSQPIPLDPSEEILPEKNHTLKDANNSSLTNVRILAFLTDATIVCIPIFILKRLNVNFQMNFILAFSLYSIVSILSFKSTPGKKILGLEVVRSNPDDILAFKNVILRNPYAIILAPEFILKILAVKFNINQWLQILSLIQMPALFFLFFADVAIFIQNKGKFSLHDTISDTCCRKI